MPCATWVAAACVKVATGHRYYDPSAGRFINRDPIGQSGGLDQYQHCFNDPLNSSDPFGLFDWERAGFSVAGGIVGGIATGGNPLGIAAGAAAGSALATSAEEAGRACGIDGGDVLRNAAVDGVSTYVGGRVLGYAGGRVIGAVGPRVSALFEATFGKVFNQAEYQDVDEFAEIVARVQDKLPAEFSTATNAKNGGGVRFIADESTHVRVDPADANGPAHVHVVDCGAVLDRTGANVSGGPRTMSERHIPVLEWLEWGSWNRP